MMGILLGKLKLFIRKPENFVTMTILTLVFAFVVSLGDGSKVNVPMYTSDADMRDSIIPELLGDADRFDFQWMSEEETEREIDNGKAEIGVEIESDGFRLLVGVDSGWKNLLRQTIQKAYMKKIQLDEVTSEANGNGSRDVGVEELNTMLSSQENASFAIETHDFEGGDAFVYDETYHALFGFMLFFVIFTISSSVFEIFEEREDGIWDRLILSPVKKWEIYAGNFIYSFLTGYIQVAVVLLVFRYVRGLDFGGQFTASMIALLPYVFAIVAVAILITGLVRTGQQYNVMISIAAMVLAMLGGAFWPLDAVESEWMLLLSKLDPITYGLELMNGIAVNGAPLTDFLLPISILLMMGVVLTGIGMHLMEKRHV